MLYICVTFKLNISKIETNEILKIKQLQFFMLRIRE
jgi:hypothetical protein